MSNTTSATISNLVAGSTYYFAATTCTDIDLESDFSIEASYTIPAPGNVPPTLDPPADLVIDQDSGPQTVLLSGISSGSTAENQTLTVTAFSSNPSLIPNPTADYASPDATGSLLFSPVTGAYGSVIMTVMVDDGGAVSNTVIRAFNVTVNQVVPPPPPLTNGIALPNQTFRFVLSPPYPNGDHYTYSLDANAPAGARIAMRRNVPALVWIPSSAQASTTNLITIHVTDTTTPALSTNETVQVIVLDYCYLLPGSTAVQAGQSATIPIAVSSNEGLTNLSFTFDWPTNRFNNPSLAVASPTTASGNVQVQGSNLVVNIKALPRQVISGSNLVAQLTFQTSAAQSSAFVSLPVHDLSATKPAGLGYANCQSQFARVAVVNDLPLLEAAAAGTSRTLQLYGRVGTNYLVQSSTNLQPAGTWSAVLSYTQTNVVQSFPVNGASPAILYRLKQQ